MEKLVSRRSGSVLLSSLSAASLLSLAACGEPGVKGTSVSAPSTGVAALESPGPAWRLQGAWSGGAGGISSAFMQLTLTGDENGDGIDDFALGLPSSSTGPGQQGSVVLLSGADLSVLKSIHGETQDMFGYAVASLGDINEDGRIDYAIGSPVTLEAGIRTFRGRVYILRSDATGSYQRTVIQDSDPSGYFGRSLAFGGGNKDVLVVSRPNFKGGRAFGYAVKYEHKEKQLYVASEDALNNDAVTERRGYFIEAISDLDGDGTSDFVMKAAGQDPSGAATFPYPGRVYFHSGRTGELLRIVEGPDGRAQIGGFTSEIGDVNADGVRDYLIGAPYSRENNIYMAGAAFVVDGAAVRSFPDKLLSLAAHPEAILRKHVGGSYIALLGFATSQLFDVDGDGVEEYAVGAPGVSFNGMSYAGQVLIYSGRTGEQLHHLGGRESFDWFGEGLRADPKSKALYIATWHANGYHGRMDLFRWTETAPAAPPQP